MEETSQNTIKEKEGASEKPFKCEQCDYASANKWSLEKHVSRVHLGMRLCRSLSVSPILIFFPGKRPFKCELCMYTCAGSSDLKRHMRNVHFGLIESYSIYQINQYIRYINMEFISICLGTIDMLDFRNCKALQVPKMWPDI